MIDVQPAADHLADTWASLEAGAEVIALTQPLATFLDFSRERHLTPVLVTTPNAHLSAASTVALRRAGALWVLRDGGALYEGLNGARVTSIEQLVADPRLLKVSERHHAFDVVTLSGRRRRHLVLDVVVHHLAGVATVIGKVADDITSSFSGSPLLWWDTHEPLLRPWSTADLTAAAKAGMPRSPVLLGAGYACWVSTRVERTQDGLLEHTHAVVALDSESAEPQVHETVMTGLRRLSTRHTLASATATLADLDDGGLRAHIRLPEVPVAIVGTAPGSVDT